MNEWNVEPLDRESRPVGAAVREPEASALAKAPAPLPDRLDRIVSAVENGTLSPAKASLLRAILRNVRESVESALKLLETAPETSPDHSLTAVVQPAGAEPAPATPREASHDDRVIEGVFDGESMIGDDGKGYSVPPNYASKSKLVEGDMLKLTIGPHGNFIYKQIGPIERQRIVGTLVFEQDVAQYSVLSQGRTWRVLKASVTYFKGEAGDEGVVLVPKNAPSRWAAVENIIKRKP
jgi:hypothetical protein